MLARERRESAETALRLHAAELLDAHALVGESHAEGLEALQATVDRIWATYLECLQQACASLPLARLEERIDRFWRTERDEYMDRPDFPEDQRERAVRELHLVNKRVGTYRNVLRWIRPALDAAGRRTGRMPRLLDLASGHGGLPIEVAALAKRERLDVEVTGSDVQPGHVERAQARARERRVDAKFRVVNALDMEDLQQGEYDVLTIVQAVHHFPPGMLARLMAEAFRIAGTGFMAIDVIRSPVLPLWLGGNFLATTGNYYFAHDAFVSARKMYDAVELELLARAAAPAGRVNCTRRFPLFNVLEILRA